MKTLAFLKTHKITQDVVSEFLKIKRTNVDAMILYDNKLHAYHSDNDSAITQIEAFGEKLPVILTDMDLYEELNLPGYYDYRDGSDFNRFMWYNSDYPIYIVQHLFPDYDYYWQIAVF